jgi:hypothetical protein
LQLDNDVAGANASSGVRDVQMEIVEVVHLKERKLTSNGSSDGVEPCRDIRKRIGQGCT